MNKGFIPIRRTLFDHFLFKEKRIFSRFEAWLDLIQLASFKDDNSDIIAGKLVTKDRGEVIASLRYLATRWSWSMHKVCDYIELLRSQDMVVVDKENGISKIMLTNFERHNSSNSSEELSNSKRNSKRNTKNKDSTALHGNEGTLKGTEKGTVGGQSGDSQGTNIKKDKKDNNEKKDLEPKQIVFINNQKAFAADLIPFLKSYSKEMIREFYDYWSEPNKSRTKMKFEMQDTWDLNMRLAKWERNQQKFGFKNEKNKLIDGKTGQAMAEEKSRAILNG